MAPKSLKKVNTGLINDVKPTATKAAYKKCRYCRTDKVPGSYYNTDDFLDTDGKMSVCIKCVNEIFNDFYATHGRLDIAIYETCHVMNVKYCAKSYSTLMRALEKNNLQSVVSAIGNFEESDNDSSDDLDGIAVDSSSSMFGKYLRTLKSTYRHRTEMNFCFDLYDSDRPEGYEDKSTSQSVVDAINVAYADKLSASERKWGKQYEEEDFAFLEDEYNAWAKTKDTDEKSVDYLIKEICCHQLNLRKKRERGENISKPDIEILTNLMDKCSLSPDKLKESSGSKNAAAWGVWLKEIETMSPAEWIENQKLFKDVEGIEDYTDRNLIRAVKNYVGMSRDFRVIATRLEDDIASGDDFSDILDVATEGADTDGESVI